MCAKDLNMDKPDFNSMATVLDQLGEKEAADAMRKVDWMLMAIGVIQHDPPTSMADMDRILDETEKRYQATRVLLS